MAKRFIYTALFEDEWFMELGKNAKLVWVYCFTKCDHAGVLTLNKKLASFETGLERKDFEKALNEIGDRVVDIDNEGKYGLLPGFIAYQYPDYPNPKNKVHASVIKRLNELGVADSEGAIHANFKGAKQGLGRPYQGAKEKEKEKEKEMDKDREALTFLSAEKLGDLKECWLDFLDYRRSSNKGLYKTQQSETTQFNKLCEYANNDAKTAREIVDQTIGNEWQGLFPLKENQKASEDSTDQTKIQEIKKWRPPEYVDKALEAGYTVKKIYKAVIGNNAQIANDGEVMDW